MIPIADEKSKTREHRSASDPGGEGCEGQQFSPQEQDQAQKLIDRLGNDREKLNAAKKLAKV